MIRYKIKAVYPPNQRYQYCNTNYALLAMVIEKVTGKRYPEYLKDSLFTPLGMKNSYVFSMQDTASYVPSYNYNYAPFPLESMDAVYGDKNVYSTVRDLLKWNEALQNGSFVSVSTLENLAYQPYSQETRGQKNYGLGWHLYFPPTEPPIIYHNGWWHGNNTVFKRLITDHAVVIILGNRFNRNIWAAGKMSSVFTGGADTTQLEQ
jgi:CubicO group peptidase (beta-lactamase class C family)